MILVIAGASLAGDDAPLALWPGAGSTLAREALLRAHVLRRDGRIEGEAFGRRLTFGTLEYAHPVGGSRGAKLQAAAFADVARASKRAGSLPATPLLVDIGIGMRIQAPATNGVIRVDVARSLNGRGLQTSIGMMPRWPKIGF